MPILFACVVNAKKKIIVSGMDPQFKSNYKDNVLEYADKFVLFGRKTIALDEKYNLHYMQEGSWAIVCISVKPDVTILEAFNFLEKVKQAMGEQDKLADPAILQRDEAEKKMKPFGKQLSKFIVKWNADPKNRDKTYLIFKELLETKDQMFDNLDLLGQREGHINELGTKAQLLRTDAKVLKKNATKARRHFCARKYMMWFFCGLAFIAIVIGVILILKLWARVF